MMDQNGTTEQAPLPPATKRISVAFSSESVASLRYECDSLRRFATGFFLTEHHSEEGTRAMWETARSRNLTILFWTSSSSRCHRIHD